MKKLIMLLISSSLLAGCSTNQEKTPNVSAKEKQEQTEKKEPEESRAKSLNDIYVPNPQVPDDTSLLSKGQTISDEKGEMELKGIASVNKVYKIGTIEMKIKNVKILRNRPVYSLMDYFHPYTENYEDFTYIKTEVEMVNKGQEIVHFGPVAALKTSSGEKKTFEDDFYIEYLNGSIEPGGSKRGAMGMILEQGKDGVRWVELTTSDVLGQKHEKAADAVTIKIPVK
ncbi:DUF4352 domain-containing protein [Peribacillus sp. SCS-37]|uniref:DUF4352 domain-containing protein n=1 Tax=Paraperibacillus esterisolvens TaxID=3115296 RepID=UPI003905E0E3